MFIAFASELLPITRVYRPARRESFSRTVPPAGAWLEPRSLRGSSMTATSLPHRRGGVSHLDYMGLPTEAGQHVLDY